MKFNNCCIFRIFRSMPTHQLDNTIPKQEDSFTSLLAPFTKEMWHCMAHTLQHIELDLIRPGVLPEPTENDTFPSSDLTPLVHFRQLRTLKIVGMLDSYQTHIWEAVWLCPQLEVLTLEMCLEPSIRSTRNREWPTIQGNWKMKKLGEVEKKYHGYKGRGQLHHTIGYGELLDSVAIGLAQKRAKRRGPVNDKLSIATLNLTSFVVDADPFVKWFDSRKLRVVNFDGFCIDAGFALPLEMLHQVKVSIPNGAIPTVTMAKKYRAGSVKRITIRAGTKVATNEAGGAENLEGKQEAEKGTTSGSSETSTAALSTPEDGVHTVFANLPIFDEFAGRLEPSALTPFVGLAANMEAALPRAPDARVKTEVERLEFHQEFQELVDW